MPSGSDRNGAHWVETTAIWWRTRSSRATMLMMSRLPPWELTITILRMPGFGNLRADRRPDGDEQLGTERQRAGAVDVFVGLADLLCRKHQDVQILRPLPLQLRQHAGRDGDIRCDRQMRAVLFRRGDRQNGNRGLGGEAGKIVCIELVPVKRRSHAVFPFRHLLR